MDVNKPVTNPQLVELIRRLKETPSPEVEKEFFEGLRAARFLTPVIIEPIPKKTDPQSSRITLEEDTKISFISVVQKDGTAFLPAFTDWPELYRWSKEPNRQTIITSLEDYGSILLDHNANESGFVINPFGASIIIRKDVLARILNKPFIYTAPKGTTVQLGEPKDYPHEMVDSIIKFLKTQKSVNRAYLQLMNKDNEFSFLIVVDFHDMDRRTLFNGIADAAKPYLKGKYIDLIPYSEAFGKRAVEGKKPFYERKRLGLF